jgi:membrane-associated HD superfamily phosphohydrolase
MRKMTLLPAMLLLLAGACTQKTETQTTVDSSGTVQTKTTTITATVPAIDTTATAEMKQDAKNAVSAVKQGAKDAANNVKQGAKDAAHATGTAMEKAGKEIQKRTKKP